MADRSVATTDTLETFRTTYNSTATDVGDISSLTGASGIIASSTDVVEAVVALNSEITAIKAGTALGKAMKKNFEAGIKLMTAPVLLKYKEKRAVVLQAVEAFLEAALLCTDLEGLRD